MLTVFPHAGVPPAAPLEDGVPKQLVVRGANGTPVHLTQPDGVVLDQALEVVGVEVKVLLQNLCQRHQHVAEVLRPQMGPSRLEERTDDRLLEAYRLIAGAGVGDIRAPVLEIVVLRQDDVRQHRRVVKSVSRS